MTNDVPRWSSSFRLRPSSFPGHWWVTGHWSFKVGPWRPFSHPRFPAFKGGLAPAPPGSGRRGRVRCPPVGGSIMSDITKSESKPARPTARPKARKPADAHPPEEADDFGAGIVDEAHPPAADEPAAEPAAPPTLAPEEVARDGPPRPAQPPRARPEPHQADGEPRRPHPAPAIDPNEHGFDAETNSRYEEIKRGNTYITQL